MRLTQSLRHLHFGNLAKIRRIVYFRLSPHEQKPFAGAISHGVPNLIRRFREQVLKIAAPGVLYYLVYAWAVDANRQFHRKNPDDFKDDV